MPLVFIIKGEDRTYSVRSFEPVGKNKTLITFNNGKSYTYLRQNVIIENVKEPLSTDSILEFENKTYSNFKTLYRSERFYRATFSNGFIKVFPIHSTKIIESELDNKKSSDIFKYYKEVAKKLGLGLGGENILEKYYNRVTTIRKDSILADYFNQKIKNPAPTVSPGLIFPFGFNLSQKQAVKNAFENPVSIIQGPPGTGKTQTILNIVANAAMNNMNISVVSGNNSAVENVFEKLENSGVDFIAAKLGNRNNKEEFISSQAPLDQDLITSWKINDSEFIGRAKDELNILEENIEEVLRLTNENARISVELSDLEKEFDIFKKLRIEPEYALTLTRKNSDNALKFWSTISRHKGDFSIFLKFIYRIIYGIKIDNFYLNNLSDMITAAQKEFYILKIQELKKELSDNNKIIEKKRRDKLTEKYSDLAMTVFKGYLAKRFSERKRGFYKMDELWPRSSDFVKDFPVVLSTTYSLRGSLSPNHIYDMLIVDESSQVDLATFILALSCAKKIVVVGDSKQLSNVITGQDRKIDDAIFRSYDIPEFFKYSENSALSLTSKIFKDAPVQVLREHYRCHPEIIGFCNKYYYDNQLIILSKNTEENPLAVYRTNEGNHARKSRINQRQIDISLQEITKNERVDLYDGSTGIVSPYKNHTSELNNQLAEIGAKNTLAATVDKFQGREKDVIIINSVDNKISDFVSDPNRLNVAVSRAKNKLILVTNSDKEHQNGINYLAKYIEYRNGEVKDSQISSIFDRLYFYRYKTVAKKMATPSEDLMYELLEKILSEEEFRVFDFSCQYRVLDACNLKNEKLKFSNRQKEFMNNGASIDFMISNKMTKELVCAIEVDGDSFHSKYYSESVKQVERDGVKDSIFELINIPLLRFSTTGSEEEKKIKQAFRKIIEQTS